jgi:predicted amidohydrolase YtcJ
VSRTAPGGSVVGAREGLTPEQALDLFRGPAERPGGPARTVGPGAPADLCLLAEPWAVARRRLAAPLVRATVVDGRLVWAA